MKNKEVERPYTYVDYIVNITLLAIFITGLFLIHAMLNHKPHPAFPVDNNGVPCDCKTKNAQGFICCI